MITINIGEIKTEKIVLSGSILALIIWREKKHQIKTREYEHKTTQMSTRKCQGYFICTRVRRVTASKL